MNYLDSNILAMWAPGPMELLVILIIAVLIFGKRLPEIGRGLGKSLMEFKKGLSEAQDVKNDVTSEVKKIEDEVVAKIKDAVTPSKAS
jgi:sec-independent protein translocase protein TatA